MTRSGHNGVVKSQSTQHRVRARTRAVGLVAVIGCLALVSAGCGGSGSKAAPTPSASALPSVAVPDGVTITEPGTTLAFGDPASVAYQPNDTRSSVLTMRVTKIVKARMADFSQYVLDARTQASTPYFVHVKIGNVGTGDVGKTDIPLWAVSQADTLIHSSGFTNTFKPCPSPALPATFGPQAQLKTCLVYLIPDHGTLTGISFRPLQSVAGIEWKGTIAVEKAAGSNKHKGKAAKHGKKKKS